jgi:hypothetical protein
VQAFADNVMKRCASIISTLRQQAPAARMVGKFAVQQASTEIDKRIRPRNGDDESSSEKQ